MNFFVRLFKLAICLIFILGVVFVSTASPSLADKCGSKDRVELPKCVGVIFGDSDSSIIQVKNRCSKSVTLKFDIKGGGDKRESFPEKMTSFDSVSWNKGLLREVSCCPRYSKCSYPGEIF